MKFNIPELAAWIGVWIGLVLISSNSRPKTYIEFIFLAVGASLIYFFFPMWSAKSTIDFLCKHGKITLTEEEKKKEEK